MTDRRLPVTVSLLLTGIFLVAIYLGDTLEGNWGFLLGIAVILLAARFVTDAWKTRLVEAA